MASVHKISSVKREKLSVIAEECSDSVSFSCHLHVTWLI